MTVDPSIRRESRSLEAAIQDRIKCIAIITATAANVPAMDASRL
jgi:hypothetical protein